MSRKNTKWRRLARKKPQPLNTENQHRYRNFIFFSWFPLADLTTPTSTKSYTLQNIHKNGKYTLHRKKEKYFYHFSQNLLYLFRSQNNNKETESTERKKDYMYVYIDIDSYT